MIFAHNNGLIRAIINFHAMIICINNSGVLEPVKFTNGLTRMASSISRMGRRHQTLNGLKAFRKHRPMSRNQRPILANMRFLAVSCG